MTILPSRFFARTTRREPLPKPELPMPHHVLGLALARKRNWDAAIAAYRQALSLKTNAAEIHFNLAQALAAKGDQERAAREYAVAHQLDPKLAVPAK
jgi:Flp pilus assembly protein TadD